MKKLSLISICLILAACATKSVAPVAKHPLASPAKKAQITKPEKFEPARIEPETPKIAAKPAITPTIATMYLDALTAYNRGQYQQALAKFSAIIQEDYTCSPAYWALGEIYTDLKKPDLAFKNYSQALQYDGKMIDAALNLARIHMQRQHFSEAKEQLDYVLNIDARQPLAIDLQQQYRQQAANFHLQQAQTMINTGKGADAAGELKLALENNPTLYVAWLELGRIQQNIGRKTEAIESYEKALEIKPDLANIWKELGKLYMQSGTYDRARLAFQRCLVIQPAQPEVQALLQEAQGNFYKLLELPEEYLKISSNQSLTRGELAAILTVNLRPLPSSPKLTSNGTLIIPDIANHWTEQFVNYTIKRGWMKPYPNHNFLPAQPVSRGELAAILETVTDDFKLKEDAAPLANPIIFIDLSPENKYFQAIMRLASLGLLTPYQKPEGQFLPNKTVSGVETLEIVDHLVERLKGKHQP